uniref:Uncharacterized protein n=1 Tax=Falco tinnunculus TaxID=100819 RepID=A0A8C4VB37_FALTI
FHAWPSLIISKLGHRAGWRTLVCRSGLGAELGVRIWPEHIPWLRNMEIQKRNKGKGTKFCLGSTVTTEAVPVHTMTLLKASHDGKKTSTKTWAEKEPSVLDSLSNVSV